MPTTSSPPRLPLATACLAIAVGHGTDLRYPIPRELDLAPRGKGVRDG